MNISTLLKENTTKVEINGKEVQKDKLNIKEIKSMPYYSIKRSVTEDYNYILIEYKTQEELDIMNNKKFEVIIQDWFEDVYCCKQLILTAKEIKNHMNNNKEIFFCNGKVDEFNEISKYL